MEDAWIVGLFLKRDERAIACAAEKYGARLRSLARTITEDEQLAEECENDTYLAAWNAIPPHRPEDYLFAFLARLTRHAALDCCRAKRRQKRTAKLCQLSEEMEECIPAPDDLECRLERADFIAMLNRFLAGLEPEKRNLFLRRYWYQDTIAQIAERYGFSESKVKTALFRCRRELRDYLEKEGYTR